MSRRPRRWSQIFGAGSCFAVVVFMMLVSHAEGEGCPGPAPAAQKLERAYNLLDSGRARDAQACFQTVLAEEPKSLAAHEGLVGSYLKEGKLERAARAADARLALTPEDVNWRKKWIEVIHGIPGRGEEAIAAARALANGRPHDLEARMLLARMLSWAAGRLDESAAEYRKAIALAPDNRIAHEALARTLVWAGHYSEAAAEYREIVSFEPTDRFARRDLARALDLAGEGDEATRVFDKLIEEDPLDAEALLGRALLARRNGDFGTAGRLLKRATAAPSITPPIKAQGEGQLGDVTPQAARLRAAREYDVTPLVVFGMIGFCVLLGYVSPRVAGRTYGALVLYTAGLVGLAVLWAYLAPGR